MEPRRPVYRPPAPPRPRRVSQSTYWRRRFIVGFAFVTLAYLGYLGVTLVMALNNPSYGVSANARIAEWGRDHGLGGIVTWAEAEYNRLNPPKVGGSPTAGSFNTNAKPITLPKGVNLPIPARMPSPAGTELPGEGVWSPAGRTTANGIPAIYETYVRPNKVNTSYVVGVAWMDQTLLQAQLYSGSYIPGNGPFKYSAPIKASASKSLVAAFNAGFRMQDAEGGYYTDGRVVLPLRVGAASVVIYKDGTMAVGKWGSNANFELSDNQIASVRQNLDLLINNGQFISGLTNPNATKWGKTLGGTFNVWRSGIGETASGAIVYVGGPSLSIYDLANVLKLAGCVEAMQLDINTDWVQYSTYQGALNTPINGGNGTSLLKGMLGPPSRYFTNWWNRDFFTMSLRPQYLVTTTTTSSKKK